jgi:hypothetical protein
MVTDRWARGWKAEVNGQPATGYGADFLFRAVRVNLGCNLIRFHYEPRTWLPSLIVSWGTLFAFVVATLIRTIRAGRKSGGNGDRDLYVRVIIQTCGNPTRLSDLCTSLESREVNCLEYF